MYVYVNILLIRKKGTLLVRILIIHNLIHYLFCLLHIFACLNTVYNKHEILPILIITFSLILMTSQVGQTTLMYLNVSRSKSVAIWRVICRGPREVTSPLHVTWLRARDVVILDVGYWMIYGTRRYPGIVSVIEVRSYQKDGFKTVYGYTFKSKFCERARVIYWYKTFSLNTLQSNHLQTFTLFNTLCKSIAKGTEHTLSEMLSTPWGGNRTALQLENSRSL